MKQETNIGMMTVEELLKKRRHGDWIKVAEKTGLSRMVCTLAVRASHNKHYAKVLKALREVVEERERAIEEALGNIEQED